MSYAEVDPILSRWAAGHGLQVMTSYRDEEVRSVELVDREGSRFQLWLDPPQLGGDVGVHVWDYRKRREDFVATPEDLAACLDQALARVSEWTEGGFPIAP